jgi:hypothetical protein
MSNDGHLTEIISLTARDSKGAAMAMFTNPNYAAILPRFGHS